MIITSVLEIKLENTKGNNKSIDFINKQCDKLQMIYGAKDLHSVYGCGESNNPRISFVFMNPTKKNVATDNSWSGLRAQWLGTKQIWDFLYKCGLFSLSLNEKIKSIKPQDWTPEFCQIVYDEVKRHGIWITNLAKCAQSDARPLPDKVFVAYKDLLMQELNIVRPQKIVMFGNQVSSIMLNKKISVSTTRRQRFMLSIYGKDYDSYSVYYPVGNGRFNQDKAIEDIKFILS